MDILHYEYLEKCTSYQPVYQRPGNYFNIKFEDMDFEANYVKIVNENVIIERNSREIRHSHWLHLYLVYKYFESINKPINEIIVELENKRTTVRKNEILSKETWIKKDLNRLRNPKKEIGVQCKFCKIKKECHRELLEQGFFKVVPDLTNAMIEEFNKDGIDPVEIVKTDQIDKFRPVYKKALYNLKAILENKVIMIEPEKKINIPQEYVIFDVESYGKRDFLFGFLVDDKYYPFVFHNMDRKKNEEMIDFIFNLKRTLVHYDVHDTKALAAVVCDSNYRKKIDEILKNSVDIYEVIESNFSFPVTSYSLKDISKYYNFNWRTNLNGQAVIIEYNRFLKGQKDAMENILTYNEDDCRATEVLIKELHKFFHSQYK